MSRNLVINDISNIIVYRRACRILLKLTENKGYNRILIAADGIVQRYSINNSGVHY